MQAGLLDTYRRPARTRGAIAWVLAALLVAFYVDVYFFEHFQPVAQAVGLKSKWTLYALLYSLAMVAGGVAMLRRHGSSRYHRLRTYSVVGVQLALGLLVPTVMPMLGAPEFYFSYFWPLKYDYLFPNTLAGLPTALAAYTIVGALVAAPLLAYFKGKRWYCSWVCGCGGLAETFGDGWRHLSDRSAKAWRVEQISIHAVLALILVTTGLLVADHVQGGQAPALHATAQGLSRVYGFAIGAVFSGVIGVGLYPLMGTRVWCRFGCPMAAILGLVQKFGRFRITVKPDMCIACGNCSTYCEMGIDVRLYAMANRDVRRASCVGCGMCAHMCPRGVLKLETREDAGPGAAVQEWTLDL